MSKITLSTDNTADLTPEHYKEMDVKIVCMGVSNILEKGDFFPDSEVTPEMVYTAIEQKGLAPKTSAGLEHDYKELFEEATKDGGYIVHFSIGNKLSASHANAKRAAQGMERVFIVDSKTLSAGTGLLVMKGYEMKKAGASAKEIYEAMSAMADRLDISFIINDLKYLHRGGRVSGLKLLGANLLKIRPSLQMDDGLLVPGKKYKGMFKKAVMDYVQDKLTLHRNSEKSLLIMATSSMEDETIIPMVMEEVKKAGFNVLFLTAGTTITIHSGRNTIGFAFLGN